MNNNNNNNNNKGNKVEIKRSFDKDSFCDFNSVGNRWVMKAPVHPIPPFNQRVHPLVVLIGWINSHPKALEKYTLMYNSAGFFAVSITPPILGHPYQKYFASLARDLLDYLLVEMSRQPRPIFFQVFSGNVVFLSHIQFILNDNKYASLIPLVKGEIFDSSPSELTVHGGKKSMAAPFPDTWFFRTMISVVFRFLSTVVDIPKTNNDFWFRFKASALKKKPKLYIYSLNDPVTPYLHVKKAIDLNKYHTDSVVSVEFDRSDHVMHLKYHPLDYIQSLYQFWDKSINEDESKEIDTNTTDYKFLLQSMISKY